jgi:hypothetical protein
VGVDAARLHCRRGRLAQLCDNSWTDLDSKGDGGPTE